MDIYITESMYEKEARGLIVRGPGGGLLRRSGERRPGDTRQEGLWVWELRSFQVSSGYRIEGWGLGA